MSNLYVRGIAPFQDYPSVAVVDTYENAVLDRSGMGVKMIRSQTTRMEPEDVGFSPHVDLLQLCVKLDGELYVWMEWEV